MANVTIFEFVSRPDMQGNVTWPAQATTALSSPAGITLSKETLVVLITCDADTTMTWNGSAATAADIPILSAIPNQFNVLPNAGPRLTFA